MWIPHFLVWVLLRRQPEWESRSLIVGGTPAEPGRRVRDLSDGAFAAGVRIGMTTRDAQARCPDALFLSVDELAVVEAQEQLLAFVERFSPDVEDVRPGVALFAAGGLNMHHPSEEALARRVVAAIEAGLGAGARVGIAGTRFSARAAAAYAHPALVIPPGGDATFLAPLPVTHLPGLAPWHWRLRFLGITTIGDYAARLPYNDVMARYGPEAAQGHLVARGIDPSPLRPRRVREPPTAVHTFDSPESRLEPLVFVLKRQLDTLCAALQRDGWVCGEVHLCCACEGADDVIFTCRPAEPTASSARLTDLLRWQIEQRAAEQEKRHVFGSGVVRLEVQLAMLSPAIGLALDLFDGSRADRRGVLGVVERLETLLGPEGIQRAVLTSGRRPEEAFSWEPFRPAPPQPAPARSRRTPGQVSSPPATGRQLLPLIPVADGRPLVWDGHALTRHVPALRLLDPPRSIQVKERDGTPTAVAAGHGFEAVVGAAGPWRLGEGWWTAEAVDRAYFQVQTRPGRVYLLYCEGGTWSLQGIFD